MKFNIYMIVIAILLSNLVPTTTAQTEIDCQAYMSMVTQDLDRMSSLIPNVTEDNLNISYDALIALSQSYERLSPPDCAEDLHPQLQNLITQYLILLKVSVETTRFVDPILFEQLTTSQAAIETLEIDIVQGISVIAEENDLTFAGDISTANGDRLDPIPFGDYYEFEYGLFRITEVIFDYQPQGNPILEDGYHVVAVYVEYVCIRENTGACDSLDAFLMEVILQGSNRSISIFDIDAVIIDEPTYILDDIAVNNTFEGYEYLFYPEGTVPMLARGWIGSEQITFDLNVE